MQISFQNRANNIYRELIEYLDVYEKEAIVINRFKCLLANGMLEGSFNADGINVSVSISNNGYCLYYDGYCLQVSTSGIEIVDCWLRIV